MNSARRRRNRPGRANDLAEAMARYRAAEEDFRTVAHMPGTVHFTERRNMLDRAFAKMLNHPGGGLSTLCDKAAMARRFLQFADLPRTAQHALVNAVLELKEGARDG